MQPFGTFKQQQCQDNDLVERLSEDVSPHVGSYNAVITSVRLPFQELLRRCFSRKSQRCKCVHDNVHPEHLDGVKWTFLKNDCAHKGHKQCDNVHCELELNELSNRIIDVSSPFASCNDTSEVIIQQNNISCIFRNFRSCNAHRESDVSFLECGSIICTITGNSDNMTKLDQSCNENVFIIWCASSENLELSCDSLEHFEIYNTRLSFLRCCFCFRMLVDDTFN